MWQDDIANWRLEHDTALGQLKQVAEMIGAHAESLNQHEHKIKVILHALGYHEKMLSESIRGGSDPYLDDVLLERHEEQAGAVATRRDAHERIKKQHHAAMAQVAVLKASFEAAQ